MFILRTLFFSRYRLLLFIFTVVLLLTSLAMLAPEQLPVIAYKLAVVLLPAITGYLFDLAVNHFSQPSGMLENDWVKNPNADEPGQADYPIVRGYKRVFSAASLRQAIIIAAFVIGFALGL